MNQYVKLVSPTGPSKTQLSTGTKLILERKYNPLSGKENEIELV